MNKIILIIFLIFSQIVLAQSTLPKCQGSDYKKYNKCFGEAIEQNGNYIGEFKNGKYHGKGIYTSKRNSKFVGEFRDGKKGLGTYTFGEDKVLINNYKLILSEISIFVLNNFKQVAQLPVLSFLCKLSNTHPSKINH